jgi:hypothetical protein
VKWDGRFHTCDENVGSALTEVERSACEHEHQGRVLGAATGGTVVARQCKRCGVVVITGYSSPVV